METYDGVAHLFWASCQAKFPFELAEETAKNGLGLPEFNLGGVIEVNEDMAQADYSIDNIRIGSHEASLFFDSLDENSNELVVFKMGCNLFSGRSSSCQTVYAYGKMRIRKFEQRAGQITAEERVGIQEDSDSEFADEDEGGEEVQKAAGSK